MLITVETSTCRLARSLICCTRPLFCSVSGRASVAITLTGLVQQRNSKMPELRTPTVWAACRHKNRRFGAPATKTSIFAHATALFLSYFPNPEAIALSVLYNLVRFIKNARTPCGPLPCLSDSAKTRPLDHADCQPEGLGAVPSLWQQHADVLPPSRGLCCVSFKKRSGSWIELWWWVELAGVCVRWRSLRVKGGSACAFST